MRQKDDEIRDALTKMESSEEVNIDEVIQPSAPLYKQLVDSLAVGYLLLLDCMLLYHVKGCCRLQSMSCRVTYFDQR